MKQKKEDSALNQMILHLLSVIAIVAVFLFLFGKMSVQVTITASDGGIVVTDPQGREYPIRYAEVEELQLAELPQDYGACVDGETKRGYHYGIWQSDEWGEYFLCVRDAAKTAIRIRQGQSILILNYEGEQSTESLYEALREEVNKNREGDSL
ncbi:MAG: hypothetical protein LUE65_07425 [Clostridiales bacterium]|nr:hypothetical protein [Clostridiales bacterium]